MSLPLSLPAGGDCCIAVPVVHYELSISQINFRIFNEKRMILAQNTLQKERNATV